MNGSDEPTIIAPKHHFIDTQKQRLIFILSHAEKKNFFVRFHYISFAANQTFSTQNPREKKRLPESS